MFFFVMFGLKGLLVMLIIFCKKKVNKIVINEIKNKFCKIIKGEIVCLFIVNFNLVKF